MYLDSGCRASELLEPTTLRQIFQDDSQVEKDESLPDEVKQNDAHSSCLDDLPRTRHLYSPGASSSGPNTMLQMVILLPEFSPSTDSDVRSVVEHFNVESTTGSMIVAPLKPVARCPLHISSYDNYSTADQGVELQRAMASFLDECMLHDIAPGMIEASLLISAPKEVWKEGVISKRLQQEDDEKGAPPLWLQLRALRALPGCTGLADCVLCDAIPQLLNGTSVTRISGDPWTTPLPQVLRIAFDSSSLRLMKTSVEATTYLKTLLHSSTTIVAKEAGLRLLNWWQQCRRSYG